MFTLKFIKGTNAGANESDPLDTTIVVCADQYRILGFNERTHVEANNKEYVVSRSADDFMVCYIENLAGKTIEKIHMSNL